MPREAIVVGGSLGGLFQGIILRRSGYNVHLFERTQTLTAQGAGIVYGSETEAFFHAFDRTRTRLYVESKGGRQYLRRDGSVMYTEKHVQRMTSWDKLYWVLRANFDGEVREGYLDNALPEPEQGEGKAVYSVGCNVTSYAWDSAKSKVVVKYATKSDAKEEEHTAEADLVVCAEGASSDWRDSHLSGGGRSYAGYVAFRGLVPEEELPEDVKAVLLEKFSFFHSKGLQFLCYLIPGQGGTVQKRRMNFVWYFNAEEGSDFHRRIFTDKTGRLHQWTMPPSELAPETKAQISELADARLPPVLAKLWHLCRLPFIQAITDARGSQIVFPDDRVLLTGDAVAGVRPHTAAGTSKAAAQAVELWQVLKDGKGWEEALPLLKSEWEPGVLRYADELDRSGRQMGNRSQFGQMMLQDNTGL